MPYLDLEAIKREIPLQSYLDRIGWKPVWSQSGQSRGPCPVHNSDSRRSRSFAVKDQGWYCHKCKIGGDVLALYVLQHNVSTYDAALALCQLFNVPVYHKRTRVYHGTVGNGEEER